MSAATALAPERHVVQMEFRPDVTESGEDSWVCPCCGAFAYADRRERLPPVCAWCRNFGHDRKPGVNRG